MSVSHSAVLRVTALQAAAALGRYERHVRTLADTWLDMDLYTEVSEEIDEIKNYCAGMPEVTVAWSGLMVSHAELIHALWQAAQDGDAPEQARRQLDDHLACIEVLSRRCHWVADRMRPNGTG